MTIITTKEAPGMSLAAKAGIGIVNQLPSRSDFDHDRMSVEEWAAVPDNPRQRDTEARLKKARHLLERSPTHQQVAMAKCFDGRRWKLDGHTRALLWQTRPELAPLFVRVDVYLVDDEEAAKRLYECFDNLAAVETSIDKVRGAYRELGFSAQSTMVRNGRIGNAVKFAEHFYRGEPGWSWEGGTLSTYKIIADWLPEIMLVDQTSPTPRLMVGPFFTAALLSFRKYQHNPQKQARISEFWNKYNAEEGSSMDGERDGVQALLSLREATKHQSGHGSQQVTLCSKAISTVERWIVAETYKRGSGIKQTNLSSYCVKK